MTDRELSNLEWRVIELAVERREKELVTWGEFPECLDDDDVARAVDALIAARKQVEGSVEVATVRRHTGGFLGR